MRSILLLIFALLAGFLLLYAISPDNGEEGVVTAVYDGDTIRVSLDGGRSDIVRLIGIDAPELDDARQEIRFLALMSKRFAFTMLYQEKVTLTYDWEKRDKYDRLLAYVSSRHGLFNEFMVRKGFASAYLKFPFRNDYRRRFRAAEKEAREEARGLWRPEPYPLVDPKDAKKHIGELVRVRFFCSGVEKRGKFWFLRAREGDFSTLIEQKDLKLFPQPETLTGRELVVSGFLEEYKGRPQLLLFLSLQLRFGSHSLIPHGRWTVPFPCV
jgi:micrococcal nuclease